MEKEYKGINWNRQKQRWIATINNHHCGSFTDQIEAVRCRDMYIITHGLDLKKLQILKKVIK